MDKFSARETEWMLELDGIPLAGFWQRAFAFVIDWIIIIAIISVVASAIGFGYVETHGGISKLKQDERVQKIMRGDGSDFERMEPQLEKKQDSEAETITSDIAIPVLYFGLLGWRGKGRTPGKRLMKIRVVSIVHRHLGLWHSVERALGYGAAALEGGFGFVQFFIHPYRRCVQDRIAETIVVTEAGYQAMQHKLSHPLIPDGGH